MDEWMSDPLTWRDVYSKKPIEYLEAISMGKTPKWDSALGKYVYADATASNTTIGGNASSTSYEDPQEDEDADGELPF
jgi:hypothetical protein